LWSLVAEGALAGWWNGSLVNSPYDLLEALALPQRGGFSSISSIGIPPCSMSWWTFIATDERWNDLNFAAARLDRIRCAVVFDPPGRRRGPSQVVAARLDVEGSNPCRAALAPGSPSARLHF